jgi:hypothetical protein
MATPIMNSIGTTVTKIVTTAAFQLVVVLRYPVVVIAIGTRIATSRNETARRITCAGDTPALMLETHLGSFILHITSVNL